MGTWSLIGIMSNNILRWFHIIYIIWENISRNPIQVIRAPELFAGLVLQVSGLRGPGSMGLRVAGFSGLGSI